ncbi:MAG: hemolysin III family protein [Gammaproteobacteria bacterium]|nr:hemolysin III family protein [Gammaproteobacteria bacterium]
MRGYIHQAAFLIALVACTILICHSHGTKALGANIIYSLTLVGLYATSAMYHSPMWGHRAYSIMRRIDHSAIFALIAGSATPICVLGLKGKIGEELLTILWSFAIIGMLITLFWSHGPKWMRAVLYLTAGWLATPYLSEIKFALGSLNIELLIIGGVVYTIGALIYAFKWPDPFPRVFGYHEIFHAFVVIASGFHFAVIYRLTA